MPVAIISPIHDSSGLAHYSNHQTTRYAVNTAASSGIKKTNSVEAKLADAIVRSLNLNLPDDAALFRPTGGADATFPIAAWKNQ